VQEVQAGAWLAPGSALDRGVRLPYAAAVDYRPFITIEPGKRGGKPCLRGLRITVYDVLEYLAAGSTLVNAGTSFPQLSNCFVMEMQDDIALCRKINIAQCQTEPETYEKTDNITEKQDQLFETIDDMHTMFVFHLYHRLWEKSTD